MKEPGRLGRYDGEAEVRFLPTGRNVLLLRPFGYIDSEDERWDVPDGAIVDGASIPQVLWSLTKGPFEGQYRNASIVHDWYCDLRSRSWPKVHRMFYEAMLTSGVATKRALLMYAGVYWGGPRWSETVVSNLNQLIEHQRKARWPAQKKFDGRKYYFQPDPDNCEDPRNYVVEKTTTTVVRRYELDTTDLTVLQRAVLDGVEPDEVTALVDRQVQSREAIEVHTCVRREQTWYDLASRTYHTRPLDG
jgi:hypothetical protein